MKNDFILQNLETVRERQKTGTASADSEKTADTPPDKQDPYGTDDPNTLDVRAASVTDCTGLIPAGTDSTEALESYAEVYHYPADIFHD